MIDNQKASSLRSVALSKEHPYRQWFQEGEYIKGFIKNIINDSIGIRIGLDIERDILGNKIVNLPDIGAIEIN